MTDLTVYGRTAQEAATSIFAGADPPDDLVPEDIRARAKSLPDGTSTLLKWTTALAAQFSIDRRQHPEWSIGIPSFGFFDATTEEHGFGVIMHVDPGVRGDAVAIKVGAKTFRVLFRRCLWFPHAPAIHPQGGRSACWATSPSVVGDGVLTAKHVVERLLPTYPKVGDPVPMTSPHRPGGIGRVADLGAPGIDAVLIEPPAGGASTSTRHITSVKYVAPFTDVDMLLGAGTVRATVTSVTDTRGSLSTAFPGRVFLSNYGNPGDSGSLIQDLSGEGVGIYCGMVHTQAGNQEGYAQHLGQVVHTMGVTLKD